MNADTIKNLAKLSKINFTEEELDKMTSDMDNIITLMEKVRDFNTDTPVDTLNPVVFRDLRKDTHQPSSPTEEIIKNAKKVTGNSFTVPKVV